MGSFIIQSPLRWVQVHYWNGQLFSKKVSLLEISMDLLSNSLLQPLCSHGFPYIVHVQCFLWYGCWCRGITYMVVLSFPNTSPWIIYKKYNQTFWTPVFEYWKRFNKAYKISVNLDLRKPCWSGPLKVSALPHYFSSHTHFQSTLLQMRFLRCGNHLC